MVDPENIERARIVSVRLTRVELPVGCYVLFFFLLVAFLSLRSGVWCVVGDCILFFFPLLSLPTIRSIAPV